MNIFNDEVRAIVGDKITDSLADAFNSALQASQERAENVSALTSVHW